MKGSSGSKLRNLVAIGTLLFSGHASAGLFGGGGGGLFGGGPGSSGDGLYNNGKVFLTGGVVTVDGAGGGGITPWATITGYETRDGINGGVHYTWVYLPDYSLNSYGAAVGFYDMFELSYTHSTLPTGGTYDTVGLLADSLGLETGIEPFNTTIAMDVFGAKLRVLGDAVYTSDNPIPQIAIGGFYKKNDSRELLTTLNAAKTKDWEAYLCATKVFLSWSTLINVTARYTSANQTGLTGFGYIDGDGDRHNKKELRWEGSIAYLLTKNTAIGGEFQQHGDNLDNRGVNVQGLQTGTGVVGDLIGAILPAVGGTLTQHEDDWYDLFFAYAPNKNISFTLAYAMLGNIVLTPDQHGFYISMHATF